MTNSHFAVKDLLMAVLCDVNTKNIQYYVLTAAVDDTQLF